VKSTHKQQFYLYKQIKAMINIGKILEKKYLESGIKLSVLAARVNRSTQAMYDIFAKENINTELLLSFCKALDYNFFNHYATADSAIVFEDEPKINIGITINNVPLDKQKFFLDGVNRLAASI
jgi:hypothetical protein